MHIIKQGKKPKVTKIFECDNCGCRFEAEKGEYVASGQMEVIHDGLPNYKCECPCCGVTVYMN